MVLHTLRFISYNGSLLSLISLSIDLYIAIIYPFNYCRIMNGHNIKIWILLIATTSFLSGNGIFYALMAPLNSTFPSSISTTYCFRIWNNQFKSNFTTFVILVIGILTVSSVYVVAIYNIHGFRKQFVFLEPPNHSVVNCFWFNRISKVMRFRRHYRGLFTTLLLLTSFLCCFLPSFILETCLAITSTFYKLENDHRKLFSITRLFMTLPILSSVLNPILYCFRLKEVKHGLKKTRCFRRKRLKRIRRTKSPNSKNLSLPITMNATNM